MQNFFQTNMVWVSCEGENPADVENIGSIQYVPRRGFPSYFFPYMNQDSYLPPLVAVFFESPRSNFIKNIFNQIIPDFFLYFRGCFNQY